MPERTANVQRKNILKQGCWCWFSRHNTLARRGANVYPRGVWFADICHVVFLWCYVCYVLFRFLLVFSSKSRPQIVSRYACAPAATHSYLATVCVLFYFVSILLLVFSEFSLPYCRFRFWLEGTLYVFFRIVYFLPCDHGLDFDTSD